MTSRSGDASILSRERSSVACCWTGWNRITRTTSSCGSARSWIQWARTERSSLWRWMRTQRQCPGARRWHCGRGLRSGPTGPTRRCGRRSCARLERPTVASSSLTPTRSLTFLRSASERRSEIQLPRQAASLSLKVAQELLAAVAANRVLARASQVLSVKALGSPGIGCLSRTPCTSGQGTSSC